jgi:poly(hydroxyalkanoate) granule-associated protein
MAAEIEVIEMEEKEEGRLIATYNAVVDRAHKTVLVGLGAAGMVQDNLEKLTKNSGELADKLIERGNEVEKGSREMVDEFVSKRRKETRSRVKDSRKDVGNQVNDLTARLLAALNMPSADDVQVLTKKVDLLNRKLNEMKKAQEAAKKEAQAK